MLTDLLTSFVLDPFQTVSCWITSAGIPYVAILHTSSQLRASKTQCAEKAWVPVTHGKPTAITATNSRRITLITSMGGDDAESACLQASAATMQS